MSKNKHTQAAGPSQQETMLRGAFWSSVGNFASRLLGVVYVIPWYAWLNSQGKGAEANALFTMGYNIYGLFLLISTVGIPVAISKQVAKYRARGQLDVVFQMLQEAMKFMGIIGVLLAAIMFLGAPLIAAFSGFSGESQALLPVLHSLAWAVLIFPVMSVIRGFFQGFNNLKPFAISQLAEQLVRVIWMLGATFVIMKMGSGDYRAAITQSTFAAFVGMLASYAVLVYYLWREGMLGIFKKVVPSEAVDTKALLVETIREAVPFIITGSAIQIFSLIDQGTYINLMKVFTDYNQTNLEIHFAYFSGNPNKIIMILVAIATSIGGVGIPLLTENYMNKDSQASSRLIVNNLIMLATILLPAVAGGILLSKPLYDIFYPMPDVLAHGLFIVCLFQTLLLALYTVLSPMIQALFENKNAVRYFIYGLVVKLVIQVPCIYFFHAYGPLFATNLALMVPIYLIFRRIHEVVQLNLTVLYRRTLLVGILTAVMALSVTLVIGGLSFFYPNETSLSSIIYILVGGGLGATVYGVLSLMTRLIDGIIGQARADQLRRKLRLP